MSDRITYCDVCECADCPRYGDDCDGDKRNDDLISRADAIEAVGEWMQKEFGFLDLNRAERLIDALSALPSAEAVKYESTVTLNSPISISAEAVQGDAISKRFVSDAILQKISELNAQGEKAIPIAREFIRFKRFVDRLTPIRTDAVSFDDAMQIRNTILFKEYMRGRRDSVQGWIPIKDGLPKPYKDVMATVWFEDDGDDDDAFEIAFGFLNKFGKWDLRLADGCECIKGFYVQAWMPLPTPYKGGDE